MVIVNSVVVNKPKAKDKSEDKSKDKKEKK
jgi:hypothetical protein